MARKRRSARPRPTRPSEKIVRVPAFGAYLKACRLRSRKKPPTVGAVTRLLQEQAIVVNHATLRGYEYGWVDSPDPIVLVGLARLYRTDIHSLVAVLAANRRNRELSEIDVERVLRETQATHHAEAEAATRLAELRERLVDIGGELLHLAGEQTPTPGAAEPRRAKNDREGGG